MILKKSILIITFCVLMTLLFQNFAFAEAKIYYVESFDDLKTMENDPNAYYVLTNNIMLDEPVEMLFCDKDKPFSGVLDGNGYTITGLKIESNTQEVAFIGYLSGTIRHINLVCVEICGGENCVNAGGLVYKNKGKIENCTFSGEIKIENKVIRGTEIAALDFGEIINCDIIRPNNASSSPDLIGDNNSCKDNEYQHTESVESSSGSTSSFEIFYSSIPEAPSVDETDANISNSASKTATSSNTKNISSSSGTENKNESISTSSKTSKTSSNKETTSVNDKSSSSKNVVTSNSKEAETTTSQYGDRQELSNYFMSSDTVENKSINIPAAVMLGVCAFALLFMCGFVVYKEVVSVIAEKKKSDNK